MTFFSINPVHPELYLSKSKAAALADTVKAWGYRAAIWRTTSRDRSEEGFAVDIHSNNGFEGYAHAL